MKKIILAALLYVSVSSLAQPITDTNQLRSFINSAIVPNNTRAITATIVNRAFNGVLNSYAPIFQRFVDTLYFTGNTMYWRQRGITYSRPVGAGVPLNRVLTINGVSYDLSADRTWTIVSSSSWGSITGSLGSQTDLQSALNAKADLSHGHTLSNITNFPTVSGMGGRVLTTDGNVVTWGVVPSHTHLLNNISNFPSVSGQGGKFLTTDGNVVTWGTPSGGGVTGIGTYSTTGNANGATISGSNLILHPATSTTPGGLSIGEQNIPGFKYFDEILTTKLARYTESNTGTASIYLRDGGAAGRIGIGKQLTSMHFFVPTDFSSYRWYGGGDFNNSAADWMSLSSSLLDIGVNARLSGYLITKNANSNTPTDQILIRGVVGGTSNCGIGKGIADMQFYSNNGYGFRWYGGGQFNNSAANWMKLDEQSLTVGASMRLSGNGGYASINEYTSNSLLIAGSLVGFGSPIQFNGPGYGRGRGEMTANGQVIFSDVNQNNTVRANSTFTVVSNSRGSSPIPVLNQSQRLAMTLSTQDIGLHVYQSDGTEGVWVYKSTGWQFAY